MAHRLSTASRCDNIAVIHEGRVAEIGSHEDLLKKEGMYAAMWDAQLKDSEETEGVESTRASEADMLSGTFELSSGGRAR